MNFLEILFNYPFSNYLFQLLLLLSLWRNSLILRAIASAILLQAPSILQISFNDRVIVFSYYDFLFIFTHKLALKVGFSYFHFDHAFFKKRFSTIQTFFSIFPFQCSCCFIDIISGFIWLLLSTKLFFALSKHFNQIKII